MRQVLRPGALGRARGIGSYQDLKEIPAFPCSLQYYSQQPRYRKQLQLLQLFWKAKRHFVESSPENVYVVVVCCLVTKSCPTLQQPHGLQPSGLLCPWDSPSNNTGVGCPFLLQRIFPTQGSNPHLLHWQVGSLPLNRVGSPKMFIPFNLILLSQGI